MQFQHEDALDTSIGNESGHRPYRYHVPSLVYVTLDQGNGGIVRDISAYGIGIQAVGRLRTGQSVLTRFDLLNPRTRIEAPADVIWADESGQAGLQFAQLSDHARRGLNDWILTNLLASIDRNNARSSMFQPASPSNLPLTAGNLPIAPLPCSERVSEYDSILTVTLPFWPAPISMRKIWLLMDGLLIFAGVLLFWLVFLAIARSLPSWPRTVSVALGVAFVFAFAYRFLFRTFAIESPGCYLATRAAAEETLDKIRGLEIEPRFR